MDQSATNQLVGNAEGVELWPPESMEGIPIVLSPNSTGDYVVQACLRSQGFNIEDVEFIYEQQAGVIEALTPDGNSSRASLGGLCFNHSSLLFVNKLHILNVKTLTS